MSTDRDTTRIVRSWLEEGVTTLPDRVLDVVLDELPTTPQRRAMWWPARRLFDMNKAMAFGLGAAAVVIVAILGFRFLVPAGPSIGDQAETPTPTASPMAWPDVQGVDLAAGTYLSDGPSPIRSTITVPEGWIACGRTDRAIERIRGVGADAFGVCAGADDPRSLEVFFIDNVVNDPCDRARALLDPPVGESVDDLVNAISNLPGFEATDPIDITRDGYVGKQFELTAPTEPACDLDSNGLGTWSTPDRTNGVGPGEVNLLRIVDVEGTRTVIAGAYQPTSTADEIAEVRAIFDSIQVAP